ncbi:tRNA (carboxymethyluridine(34)-5-O)-methyltransferase [Malassezia cuniculi]|uniref:tRNA (Carboxymethyluridine(34)-5-O)-methyltransferase n=1 Tax=Malassezia cuniculi TaxID=948313 RepID=A0AAF0EZV7_9BASI|nr:tRNA (carboxymethyluridine(34)-5-O)-methyltransferase [Malassezia cuniculi]
MHSAVHPLAAAPMRNGEELHAFSQAGARPLGLYGGAGERDFFAAIDRLQAALRGAKERIGGDDASARTRAAELSAQSVQFTAAAASAIAAGASAKPDLSRLPEILWVGVLAGAAPQENKSDAFATLDALCKALEHLASSLNLECFVERAEGGERTHTFTSGGKIFVLDVELGMTGSPHSPATTLKLSYAHDDASQGSASGSPGDTRLADMLRKHLEELAAVLFGAPATPTAYARACYLWSVIARSLETMAYTDELSAKLHGTADLFVALGVLGTTAESVSLHEAAALGQQITAAELGRDDIIELLTKHGHGASLLHVNKPYLDLVYWPGHTATIRVSPTRLVAADRTPDVVLAGSDTAASLNEALTTRLQAAVGEERITFVAHLDPPLVVPHRALRALWDACGLEFPSESNSPAALSGSSYIASRLGTAAEHGGRVSFSAGTHREEVRNVSILPFERLAQLYAALEVLKEYIRVDLLLARAQSKPAADTLSVTLELNGGPGLVASFVARKAESVQVTATLVPKSGTWLIAAQAGDKHLDDDTAAALAAQLTSGTGLDDIMYSLHDWA